MTTEAPTLARLALGRMLIELRTAAGLDHAAVAEDMDVHPDTVRRWETGQHSLRRPMLRDLARIYNATSVQLARMTTLAEQGKQRGAVERYPGGASPEFRMFADFESTAVEILSYEPEYVPGLLQVPDYLRAVHAAQLPGQAPNPEAIHKLRASRHRSMFSRKSMPSMRFVIGVAAMIYLRNLPHDVREAQFSQLISTADLPNVEVRIVTTMHSAMNGGFTILEPAQGAMGANRFVYIEAQDVCRYVEAKDVVSLYDEIFRSVWDRAVSLKEYLNDD
jgi:transcriptional regulator with XRE-family HTH domain